MHVVACPHCKARVVPLTNGDCLNCSMSLLTLPPVTALSDTLSDDEGAKQYLEQLARKPENVAQSYEALSVIVQLAIRDLLDKGDAEFYSYWFTITTQNGPRVDGVSISDEEFPPTITIIMAYNCTVDCNWFLVEVDHPARIAIESLRKYLSCEDNSARSWVRPSVIQREREWKVRREVDLQRRILPNSAAKRMLRSCFAWQGLKEIASDHWIVYDGFVTIVYDSQSQNYAQLDSNGNVGSFESLGLLVARLEKENDPSIFPNAHTSS